MPLDEIRKTIDAIDTQLLDLLSQRADAVHKVGEIKKRKVFRSMPPSVKTPFLSHWRRKIRAAFPKNRFALSIAKSCRPLLR